MTRNRTLRPAVPFAELYGNSSGQVTPAMLQLTFDHNRYMTTNFLFVAGTTKLTVKQGTSTGLYMVYASIGATVRSGVPSYILLQMFKNGSACACAIATGIIGTGTDHSTAVLVTCVELQQGDYLEWKASIDAGEANIVDDELRVIVKGIEMKGWDNKRGGLTRKWA